jgi:hypothetical protein
MQSYVKNSVLFRSFYYKYNGKTRAILCNISPNFLVATTYLSQAKHWSSNKIDDEYYYDKWTFRGGPIPWPPR